MATSTHIAPVPRDELRVFLRAARDELRQRADFTEEDTRNILISPLLDKLGYGAWYRRSEFGDKGNTPDEVIYVEPPGTSPSRYCQIILEAKALKTNLDMAPAARRLPSGNLSVICEIIRHPAQIPLAYSLTARNIAFTSAPARSPTSDIAANTIFLNPRRN